MERLSIVTLNIWNRSGPWDSRLAVIRAELERLSPDVVGLQEVLAMEGAGPNQAEQIAEGLGYSVHYGASWTIGPGLEFGNAILSKHEIVGRSSWELPPDRGGEKRMLVHALVDAPCGVVPMFVTHLAWRNHESERRCVQIRAATDHITQVLESGSFPAVLVGDFNAEPDSDEMRFLRGLTPLGGKGVFFADCWAVLAADGDFGTGYTYSRANKYAVRSREPSRRIDYVYVRGPDRLLRGEPLECRVAFDKPVEGVYASDHFGVYAEIQAAPRSQAAH